MKTYNDAKARRLAERNKKDSSNDEQKIIENYKKIYAYRHKPTSKDNNSREVGR